MTSKALKIAASAFALGIATIGCTPQTGAIETAGSQSEARAIKAAAKEAGKASKLLAKGQADKAVSHAEAAVAARPQDAGYRALLGKAYLAAGRFASAEAALRDTLTLDPSDGASALSLALAQTAQGNWAGARETLNAHQAVISPSDRGLAFALAGDPVLAVDILSNAARAPDADAKTRQNFALALALAGRWAESKVIAAQDVAPQDVDARIMQWARFSQPREASDQVASLLGVTPAFDPGQPVQLALAQSVPVAIAAAEPVVAEPVPAPAVEAPVEVAQVEAAPIEAPAPIIEQVEQAVAMAEAAKVTFLPQAEVVQAIPTKSAPLIRAEHTAMRMAARLVPVAQGDGRYVVQIGAYDSAAVAEDSWNREVRRHKLLANYTPSSMTITKGEDAGLVRVSLAGFESHRDAAKVCRSLKASGARCFVRMAAADTPVRWASVQRRLASR